MLINCIFIEDVPLEFFWFESLGSIFGGGAVFYLGVYGFGTLVSQDDARASTLARYDGLETLGLIFGTLLSPLVLSQSAIAAYACKIGTSGFAILYLVFIVKEPAKPKTKKVVRTKMQILVKPLVDMVRAIFKIRPNKLHLLLAIQFYCFGSYWFSIEEKNLRYLYLNKTMDFDGVAFSWLTVFMTICNTGTVFENHPKCRIWILAFSTNVWPIETDLSGKTVWPQASGFQKLAKMHHFWHF